MTGFPFSGCQEKRALSFKGCFKCEHICVLLLTAVVRLVVIAAVSLTAVGPVAVGPAADLVAVVGPAAVGLVAAPAAVVAVPVAAAVVAVPVVAAVPAAVVPVAADLVADPADRHFHPHSDPDSPPSLPDGIHELHLIPAHTVKIPSENVLHVPLT